MAAAVAARYEAVQALNGIETILAYHQGFDTSAESYHFTLTRKFIRVILGLAIPMFDRVKGAGVVVAENYKPSGPASWVILAATCGEWGDVQNDLVKFRQDLKFNRAVCDTEEHIKHMLTMKAMKMFLRECPIIPYAAPSYANSEVGRSLTDELIRETRLVGLEEGTEVRRILELEPQMGQLALNFVTAYCNEFKAHYKPVVKEFGQSMPLGVVGL